MLFLCACNNLTMEIDKQDTIYNNEDSYVENQTKTTILYGITYPDPDERSLEYNGEPIQIKFKAENGPINAEWGLRIYVDGYLQPFIVENKEYDLYCFEMNEKEIINFDLLFTPIVGNDGDKLTVHFILYLNPSYVLRDKEYVGYDNNHKITQLLPWKLIINKSVKQEAIPNSVCQTFIDIPENLKSDLTNQIDENAQPLNLLESNSFVEHFQKFGDYNTILVNDCVFNTFIQGYGKAEKYRISLYVNHAIVNAFDGKPYCIFEIKNDFLSQISANVTYDFEDENNFVYVIAVPILEEYDLYATDVIKTNSMKVILE